MTKYIKRFKDQKQRNTIILNTQSLKVKTIEFGYII